MMLEIIQKYAEQFLNIFVLDQSFTLYQCLFNFPLLLKMLHIYTMKYHFYLQFPRYNPPLYILPNMLISKLHITF